MMYTSIAIFALAELLAPRATLPSPTWWRDYQIAQEKGVKERKPLAVFVGNGQGGYHALAREGELSDTIQKVLAESYVCVYLDTTSSSQTGLIQSLNVTKNTGLVLSDRTGNIQAYHHDGPMTVAQLETQLQHFADPDLEVHTTLSNTNQRYSFYPTGSGYQSFAGRSC